MIVLLSSIAAAIFGALRPRTSLVAENLALRQQLAVLRRAAPRPRLRPVDRAFWVVLSRAWSRCVETLVVVKPETVIGWHRRGFVRFWVDEHLHLGLISRELREPRSAEQVRTRVADLVSPA